MTKRRADLRSKENLLNSLKNNSSSVKKIDWEKVKNLLVAGCSGVEIASNLGINNYTLYDRCVFENDMSWTEYSQIHKARGDAMIRVTQFKEAVEERDRGMLIWLGKQRLGQRDKHEHEVETNQTITHLSLDDLNEQQKWNERNSCPLDCEE